MKRQPLKKHELRSVQSWGAYVKRTSQEADARRAERILNRTPERELAARSLKMLRSGNKSRLKVSTVLKIIVHTALKTSRIGQKISGKKLGELARITERWLHSTYELNRLREQLQQKYGVIFPTNVQEMVDNKMLVVAKQEKEIKNIAGKSFATFRHELVSLGNILKDIID